MKSIEGKPSGNIRGHVTSELVECISQCGGDISKGCLLTISQFEATEHALDPPLPIPLSLVVDQGLTASTGETTPSVCGVGLQSLITKLLIGITAAAARNATDTYG